MYSFTVLFMLYLYLSLFMLAKAVQVHQSSTRTPCFTTFSPPQSLLSLSSLPGHCSSYIACLLCCSFLFFFFFNTFIHHLSYHRQNSEFELLLILIASLVASTVSLSNVLSHNYYGDESWELQHIFLYL